jgi:hypothetical protein
MFEQAKNMMDNAMSHNDALSQIENQRSGRQTHTTRNVLIGVAVLAVIILAIVFR